MKIFFIPFIIWVLSSIALAAQQPVNTLVNDIIMPAPNAASLGKYADIPISYNTGVPNIDLPLYEVKEGPLRLPISVSYHASGIRVGEAASWVGLGWSLNAGGLITRTVLGKPDEFGYFVDGASLQDNPDVKFPDITIEMADALEGIVDSEPDIFTFNFNGYVGKFFIDHSQNKVFIVPQQDLDISYNFSNNTIISFIIKTPDGTKYHFGNGKIEITNIDSTPGFGFFQWTSSWYMDKVESSNGMHTITLSYDAERYKYSNLSACGYMETLCPQGYSVDLASCGGTTHPISSKVKVNYQYVDGLRLANITNNGNTVNIQFFASSQTRQDLDLFVPGQTTALAKYLDKIEITNGTFCKRWLFGMDYFVDTNASSYSEGKRLRLKSLKEMSCSGTDTIPAYTFDYFGDNFMPHRLSKAIDHWGYYNGSNTNNNYLLNVPPVEFCPLFGVGTIGQSDREPDSTGIYMSTGTLKTVNYPTKGAVFFTYEPNKAYAPENLVQRTTFNTLLAKLPSNCFDSDPNNDSFACCTDIFDITDTNTKIISLTTNQLNTGGFTFEIRPYDPNVINGPNYCPQSAQEFIANLTITGPAPASTVIYNENINTVPDDGNPNTPYDGPQTIEVMFSEIPVTQSGNYTFTLTTYGRSWSQVTLFRDTVAGVINNQIVGGLRIKEIRKSADNTPSDDDIVRFFEYNKKDDITQSSGLRNGIPQYHECTPDITAFYETNNSFFYYFVPITIKQFIVRDNGVAPLRNMDGRLITYSFVTEYFGPVSDKTRNGRIEHYYQTEPYSGSMLYNPPIVRLGDGLLLSKKIYNSDGNLIQSDSIEYKNINYETFDPNKLVYNATYLAGSCDGAYTVIPYFTTYRPRTKPILQEKTISVLDGVATTTSYSYDPTLRHLNPTTTSITNSDNKVFTTRNRYVFDWNSSALRDTMITRNMIGMPVSVTTETGINPSIFVKRITTEYSFFDRTTGFPTITSVNNSPYPYKIHERLSNTHTIDTLIEIIERRDTIGNIIQVKRNHDQSYSFIWSNYNRFVAAKILNATHNEVAYTSFETPEAIQGGWTISNTSSILYNTTGAARTGNGYYGTSANISKTGLPAGKYILSYYTKSIGNVSINGGTILLTRNSAIDAQGWYYTERIIQCTANATVTVNVNGTYIDEVRLYPADALMTSYSINKGTELLTTIAGENAVPIFYEYDALSRLQGIRNFNRAYLQAFEYNNK
ncbi:MAG TPA: hypothetical protein PKD85_02295, partial [Saprospiraceae bacterium]|nr:hypothetical protein [Saprospiraceae bacterium]